MAALDQLLAEARACTRCPLAETRAQVVTGEGNAGAELMLVGEAPGRVEEERGGPFAGPEGRLLDELLAGVGLRRDDVFVTGVVLCRTPHNREPLPLEIDRCRPWLWQSVELVRPAVVCTLGGFATKLLRGDPAAIRALHGRPEVRTVGSRAVHLLPLYHPAAALYNGALLDELRADFAQIPALLAGGPPPQPVPAETVPEPAADPEPEPAQLGLF